MLLIATQDGVYRVNNPWTDDIEFVLDSGATLGLQATEIGVFAASKTGLYRSVDQGQTWNRLNVPRTEVFTVAVSPDLTRLYAGTHPAHMFVSMDKGSSWSELESFQDLPSRHTWHTPRHRNKSHVRSIGVHPDLPELIIAGVEVGGVHVSDDYGKTWEERRKDLDGERTDDLQFDVHHVLALSADEFVISCGGGLYRTCNAGRRWTKLNVDPIRAYFQSSHYHGGTLFAAAQTLPPSLPFGSNLSNDRVDARLFESNDSGESFEKVAYPGEPEEFVYAWASGRQKLCAGTTGGRIMVREQGSWSSVAHVPEWVRSLAYLDSDGVTSEEEDDALLL